MAHSPHYRLMVDNILVHDATALRPDSGVPAAKNPPGFRSLRRKIRAIEQTWSPSDGSPVLRSRAGTPAAAGPSGRRAFSSARPSCSSTPPARGVSGDRARAHRERDGAARQPHRRPRSRVQQRQHVRQSAAADERGRNRGEPLGAAVLRDGAEVLGRGAGRRWSRTRTAAGTFIRSTGRTRCSWTRSARCGR